MDYERPMVIPALIWALIGIALLVAEMVTLTFVLVFFGAGALIVALIKWGLGLESLPVEVLLFAVISIAGLFLLRRKLKSSWVHKGGMSIDQGTVVVLTRDVPPRGRAEIEYQGTLWTAENETDQLLSKGSKAVIVKTDGLRLIIRGG